MQKKTWIISKQDEELVKEVSEKYNISPLASSLVLNRVEKDEIETYINPTLDKLYDPFLMKDMMIAVERILEALENKEKIMIYGDYDVDGVTSTTCVYSFLRDLYNTDQYISYYLPHRLDEGYGLNKEAMKSIKDQGYDLVITVDCGVSAFEEVEYANSIGLQIIITDHHECSDIVPNAYAIINPKQKDCMYPFKQLAGVGVAFKLIMGLAKKINLDNESYLKYLDLVSLGTIADIVPLVNENRVIAKEGINRMSTTKNVGVRKLIEVSGCSIENIDSITLSYTIAPRINACGRMEKAVRAVELLLETDEKKALLIAEELNSLNKKRQEIEKEIFDQAVYKIEHSDIKEKEVIVLAKEGWHHGIIGIVASKLTEMYYKPTILFSFEGEIGKGSGRSIKGISLYETLTDLSKYLIQFGGHELAAGLSIKKENYYEFKEAIEEYMKKISYKKQPPEIQIDNVISASDISTANIQELEILKPFGQSNPAPIFALKNAKIDSLRVIGDNKHLKLTIKDNNTLVDAIGFGLGRRRDEIILGDKIDIACSMEINNFNNISRAQLNIKDFKRV